MKTPLRHLLWIAAVLVAAGCRKNPIERLVNPYNDAAVPGISGTFTIFDDELKTGGAVGFIPGGESQAIDFGDRTSPRRSANQIRYSWTGGDVMGPAGAEHDFAGFSLFSAPTVADAATARGRDLSAANYTTLRFWVRGTLAQENILRIEGPSDGTTSPFRRDFTADELADWTEITMNILPGNMTDVRSFMTVSIQYAQPPRTTVAGGGGTVFFDDVRYEQ